MKVFISWSGSRSQKVGELLDEFIQCVVQAMDPWISNQDIDRGALWFSEISNQLKDTSLGIICLTKENKEKPWILFEAGALAKGLSTNRVCIVLIDLEPREVEDPLAQFNLTIPDETGIRNLIRTLNNSLGENKIEDKILDKVFKVNWQSFKKSFDEIISSTPETTVIEKRPDGDILNEILSSTRQMDKRLRDLELNKSSNLKGKIGKIKINAPSSGPSDLVFNELIRLRAKSNSEKEFIELCQEHGIPSYLADDYIEYQERLAENE